MPLLLEKQKDKFSFIVWKIDEDLSFFLDKFEICDIERSEISKYPDYRLLEWWSSRYLLFLLENEEERSCVLKDSFGKPYLQNSDKKISLSHSGKNIAAVISDKNIGIDIQNISPKVDLIKKKFLTEKELEFGIDPEILNLMWTIKEAVYKAYGKKKLSFKENIIINGFKREKNIIISNVFIEKNNTKIKYKVVSYNIEKAILSIAIEELKRKASNLNY